jgi:hypothetical protein
MAKPRLVQAQTAIAEKTTIRKLRRLKEGVIVFRGAASVSDPFPGS